MRMAVAVLALAAILGLSMPARASPAGEYPSRPLTLVVPFAAGGPTDSVARLVAESMTVTLGQRVLVANVIGAGGTRGAGLVAKSVPDGYILLIHHLGLAISPGFHRELPYDPGVDFEPVGLITAVPMALMGRQDFAPWSVAEVIEYVKASGGKVVLGHAGVGSASHLCGMLLMSALQIPLATASYQGTHPAMNDLIDGRIDLLCDQTTNAAAQIKAGKVKAYGVTSKTRVAILPALPTLEESGLKGFGMLVWHGLYVPRGTPQAVVARLGAALDAALGDPKVMAHLADLGTEPEPRDRRGADFHRDFLTREIQKWKPVIESVGGFAD